MFANCRIIFYRNFKLLSFGEEAEEDEEESVVLSKQFNAKGKSAHDNLVDPKLSSEPAIEIDEPPSKKRKSDEDSDADSDGERKSPDEDVALSKENQ